MPISAVHSLQSPSVLVGWPRNTSQLPLGQSWPPNLSSLSFLPSGETRSISRSRIHSWLMFTHTDTMSDGAIICWADPKPMKWSLLVYDSRHSIVEVLPNCGIVKQCWPLGQL